jgi:EAL domain-containing protein (putative c-di-GMP-specific phosphodiesterase class I)
MALREAKSTDHTHAHYTSAMGERLQARQRMESQLERALENGEFLLHYQPKVHVDGRQLAGFEALIRWRNPELGLVSPARFVPLLEETGLIAEVGLWVLREAQATRAAWIAAGYLVPRIAINVSTLQLGRADFAQRFRDVLGSATEGGGLDIEVTESLIIEDSDSHIGQLREIRKLGMRIAIDDFGTGYSSLGYLARLPIHTLKIDRSFITTMLHDPGSMTLVSTIISLAHALKLSVVAEGVEKEEQAKILRLLRCDEMQGYLISQPVCAEEVPALLRRLPV